MWVEGEVTPAIDEDPLKITMRCLVCESRWKTICPSGLWSRRIELFALVHYECWHKPVG